MGKSISVENGGRPVAAPSSPTLPTSLHSKLLRGLTAPEIKAVLGAAKQQRIFPNEVLQHEGDTSSHLSLLVTGLAAFYKTTPDGRKLFLRFIAPGDAFGLTALLQIQQPQVITVHAMHGGLLFVWDRVSAHSLALRIPQLVENAYTIAGDYLKSLADALAARASQTAPQRIARVLVESLRHAGCGRREGKELAFTNEQLAQMADVNLYTVSRCLNEWQSRGILTKGRGKIMLLAPRRLNC